MVYKEIIDIMLNISNSSLMTKKVPMKIKLPILYNIDKFRNVINNWELCYKELLNRYANKDRNGNIIIVNENYNIKNEFIDIYNEEFNDLIMSQAGISKNDLQKIPLAYFDEYDEEKFDILTLSDIQALQFMIEVK